MLNCKKILTSVAAGALLFSINATEKKQTPKYKYTHRIKCISDSGEARHAPSRSMAAFRLAMERKADAFKLDIRYTKDQIPVLTHNDNLKSAMNWNVSLGSKTLAELKERNLKPGFGYNNEKIVSLPEVLEIIKDAPEFELDHKGYFREERFRKTLEEFGKAGISLDRVTIASWSDKVLRFMMREYPNVRRVKHIQLCYSTKKKGTVFNTFGYPETGGNPKDIVKLLLKVRDEYKLYGLNLPLRAFKQGLLNADHVKTLRDAGVWVSLWNPQNAEEAKFAAEIGVDAVVTGNLKEVRPFCRIPESENNNHKPNEENK